MFSDVSMRDMVVAAEFVRLRATIAPRNKRAMMQVLILAEEAGRQYLRTERDLRIEEKRKNSGKIK